MGTLLDLIEDNYDLTWSAEPYVGTDKHIEHNYIIGFYDKNFESYRDLPIRLLEIGIYKGASLALWQKYFKYGQIFGIDIEDQRVEKYINLDRVQIAIADAYRSEVAKDLGSFDIIIDDGPHTIDTLQKCIQYYLPQINKGGMLVLEDIQDTSWFPLLQEVTPPEYLKNSECLDLRHYSNRYDDLMYIVRL